MSLQTGKDASGHISLRSAIMAANARPNADTIILGAGTFKLAIAGSGEDNAATGDLDIRGKLSITGKGASRTIIDGDSLDRVFDVLGGKVSISKVTIQHGRADHGGGLQNRGGNVTLSAVAISNNLAIGSDGTAGAAGTAGMISGGKGTNAGAATDGEGGGVFNAGTLNVAKSVIATNMAKGGRAGGIGGRGGDATVLKVLSRCRRRLRTGGRRRSRWRGRNWRGRRSVQRGSGEDDSVRHHIRRQHRPGWCRWSGWCRGRRVRRARRG